VIIRQSETKIKVKRKSGAERVRVRESRRRAIGKEREKGRVK